MKILFTSAFIAILLIGFQCCNNIPVTQDLQTEKIMVGPGPEDMVLDTSQSQPRLLISCTGRRESHKPYGEIMSINLPTGTSSTLIRHHEPENLLFRPHGIYLDKDLLYVISHEKEPDFHPILVYRLHGDSLEFKDLIHTSNQHSPNALVTGAEGEIYFVNDSGKRGSITEKALKLKRASVVRLSKDDEGKWISKTMVEDLGYPAGINRIGNKIFAGDAVLHRIYVYQISDHGLTPVNEFRNLRGNDNIRIHKGRLLTVGHIKPLKFIQHAKNQNKLSPIEVYEVNPISGEYATLYHTNGTAISAGSVAVIFGDQLYIGQVFDPYILKVGVNHQ